MISADLIQQLVIITNDNSRFVQKNVTPLTMEQLNWQKNSQSWSIGHILLHLNEYARFYHTEFKRRIEQTRFKDPTIHFISSPLGKSAWKAMKLGNAHNIKRAFHSPKQYNPLINKQLTDLEPTKVFLEQQKQLESILEHAKLVNLRKVKIPISISKIIRFRLGDALQYVVYHNERHIQQIKNVMIHPEFPK